MFALTVKSRFAVLLSLAGLLTASVCSAGFVTDQAGLLDDATRRSLESVLAELEQKTSAEIAVVTVTSLRERPIEDASVDLFKSMGIGKKGKDNGLLFLIAPGERKVRIEVGYGLEGILPDARTGRILDEAVLPEFRAGRMAAGVRNGVLILANLVAAAHQVELSEGPAPAPGGRRAMSRMELIGFILIVIVIVFLRSGIFGFFPPMGGGGLRGGGGFGGFGGGGGGFGGFGGGLSGGGGSSRGW